MAQVALVINGRSYRVACDDGQEERVRELGRAVDDTVKDLAGRVGQVGEMQLLVMAALLLADQVDEAEATVQSVQAAGNGAAEDEESSAEDAEAAAVAVLEACANRLEGIAERLERP